MRAVLVLEDGTTFFGVSCGAEGERVGELVFNTSMTGYQEILMDPSYKGQMVVMTYPQIGNYGITAEDVESKRPWLEGFIVREMSKSYSNWQSREDIQSFLIRHAVVAIEGIDTRALTRRLRDRGVMKGILSTMDSDVKTLQKKVKVAPSIVGMDLVQQVTCLESYEWTNNQQPTTNNQLHVIVMDFGVKYSILRCLAKEGFRVTVVPAHVAAEEILSLKPDGIVLSNGPGDPEPVTYAVDTVKRLLESGIPIFGICLGHQILGLALGGKTYKLKFGHHGANHPVKDLATGKIEITSQNHGFCVDLNTLPKEIKTTHINLNDQTSEGMAHVQIPVFSVQYHPEAGAGPHDSRYLFGRFKQLVSKYKKVFPVESVSSSA
ncbi:MAG: glutamine-hydrolyzing carbamoyl-phosphate synthase small subunit [Elusimicrobia bacterium]|nr:glutamine-hydrolyzing carbamoyl-phosphate synthase small subunit [Elusimicrobiota bacterium]